MQDISELLYNTPGLPSVWCCYNWEIDQEFPGGGGKEMWSCNDYGSAEKVFQAPLSVHQ